MVFPFGKWFLGAGRMPALAFVKILEFIGCHFQKVHFR